MHEFLDMDFMDNRARLYPGVYEDATKAAPSYSSK